MNHPCESVSEPVEKPPLDLFAPLTRLAAIQRLPHIYAGTVPFKTVQERRKKNRVAKRSRKLNRGK